MRIDVQCAYADAIRKTKSVCAMRIVGKKNKVKNRTKLGRRRARAQKWLKFLTKIVKILSKIGQKMGPKW